MDLYQRYGPALLRKCERMLGNSQDAEDIVQGLFVDLLTKGKTDFDLPYLYRASTNRCLNFIRDKKKRRDLLAQQGDNIKAVSRAITEDRVIDKDVLVKLVRQLDKKSCEILVYRYFDDLTQEEISELTNTSRKTIGKRLKKIKQKVQDLVLTTNGAAPAGGLS